LKHKGTSALRAFINIHPQIQTAPQEVNFFDRYYNRGLNWYINQMPYLFVNQIAIEKTPAYFTSNRANVPKLVHQMNPKIKLILLVKNPVERTISDYAQILHNKKVKFNSDSYDEFSKQFEEKILNEGGKIKKFNNYIYNSLYIVHLKRWLEYFPIEQFLILSGDELVLNPYIIVRKVELFLNFTKFITKDRFEYSEKKGFMCIKNIKIKRLECLNESKGRTRPFIAPHIIDKLKEFYKPYDEEFFKTIKQNPFW
jgi:hypothetical protein